MSDLRRALRHLDTVGPEDAVFRRARTGPNRPLPPRQRHRADRLVAGLTAATVFVGAALFAAGLLGGDGGPSPDRQTADVVEVGADGSTLWPQRTHVDLVSAQSRTDAGNGGFRWQLDPLEVIDRFAESVVGWPLDSFRMTLDRTRESQGTLVAHLERTEETCPPFTQEEEDRGVGPCLPGIEDVTLVQPLRVGDGGVWVVAAVRSPDIEVDLVPGEIVGNGASVIASVDTSENLHAARSVVIGGFGSDRNCFGSSGDVPDESSPEVEVRIEPDRTAGSDCGESASGYVVAATSTNRLVCCGGGVVADPLNADSSPYVSVTAIPILVSIPENKPTPGMNVYEDPLGGWKVDLPEPWYVAPANDVAGERTLTISNIALPIEADTFSGPDPTTFQADAVVLEITKLVGRPEPATAGDDSSFPLDSSRLYDLFQTEEAPAVEYQGNGQAYQARLFVGTEVPDDDIGTMLDVVRSLRFPAMPIGEAANGWLSLGDASGYPPEGETRGTPAFVNRWGVIYVVRGTGGVYVLDLELEECGEGGNQSWDTARRQIVIGCPGLGEIRYTRSGAPLPDNPTAFADPLEIRPAITAWDGTLLVSTTTTLDGVARYWPHA